ncbi:MAG: TetR/AcrR family transcriptional regulator [Alphaproteobacteria bacterium]|jgi:TetR/AcrR family transcriptional repressor of nem operon|nr:TetR/AcrR family transcriptional regulator [Alphaproteobacteria bacterium]MDP6830716.1 TetR/AcrR family transcriptional regulator [Alphaproteobacteria bacterium]
MNASMTMRDRILDAAERRIRGEGYNAVSFRNIADDVGVKSASVHYHFPQKQDLGAALVRRYRDGFLAELQHIATRPDDRAEQFRAYLKLYRDALVLDKSICLCAILGAETLGLPDGVKSEVRLFFQANIDWLAETFAPWPAADGQISPAEIVSALEGAMIIAAVMGDGEILDRTIARMQSGFDALGPG